MKISAVTGGVGDVDGFDSLEELAHSGVVDEPEMVHACAKSLQTHIYYLSSILIQYPRYIFQVH